MKLQSHPLSHDANDPELVKETEEKQGWMGNWLALYNIVMEIWQWSLLQLSLTVSPKWNEPLSVEGESKLGLGMRRELSYESLFNKLWRRIAETLAIHMESEWMQPIWLRKLVRGFIAVFIFQ